MTNDIKNKVIVITGAGSGLDAEAARALHELGAKVVLGDLKMEVLQALAKELDLPKEAIFQVDVRDREAVKDFVDRCSQSFWKN